MIYLGSDHAGFKLKEKIKIYLAGKKIKYKDLGTNNEDSVDASDYAVKVVNKIKINKNNKGILVCGSGIMMSIVANRFKNVRAALAWTPAIAKQARQHNNANILVLSGREASPKSWKNIIDVFFKTKSLKKTKYINRLKKLEKICPSK